MSKAEIPTKTRPTPFGKKDVDSFTSAKLWKQTKRGEGLKRAEKAGFLEDLGTLPLFLEVVTLRGTSELSETQIECDV